MGLYKRSDSDLWWYDITINGRRVRASTGTADRKQATEIHDKIKADSWRITRLGEKPVYSWRQAVVRYLKESEGLNRVKDDLPHLRWLDKVLGGKNLCDIDRDLLDMVATERAKPYEETHYNKQGVATKTVTVTVKATTVRRTLDRLMFVLKQAREWGWIDTLPPKPKVKGKARTGLEIRPQQYQALLDVLPSHLKNLCEFSIETGLRQANALRLQWDWVFAAQRMVVIPASHFKQGRAHGLPLSKRALEILSEQHGKHSEFVFTYRGKPMRQIQSKTWKKYLNMAGIEHARWHDLRHTWASQKVQAGVPLRAVQEMAGWSSLRMVERYSHLQVEHLLEYADAAPARAEFASRLRHGDSKSFDESVVST